MNTFPRKIKRKIVKERFKEDEEATPKGEENVSYDHTLFSIILAIHCH